MEGQRQKMGEKLGCAARQQADCPVVGMAAHLGVCLRLQGGYIAAIILVPGLIALVDRLAAGLQ